MSSSSSGTKKNPLGTMFSKAKDGLDKAKEGMTKAKDNVSHAAQKGLKGVQGVVGHGMKGMGDMADIVVEEAGDLAGQGIQGVGDVAELTLDGVAKVIPFEETQEKVPPMSASVLEAVQADTPDEVEQAFLEEVKLVVEIVAARDLIIGDLYSSDPYVKVVVGTKDLHKTKHVSKTLNPIYTPENGSTFLLDMPATEISDAGGLKFVIKDYDRLGFNDMLGTVEVAYPMVARGATAGKEGILKEFEIIPPVGVDRKAGFLLLRAKKATEEDVHSLLKEKRHPKNLFSTTTAEAASSVWDTLKENESSRGMENPVEKAKDDSNVSTVEERAPNFSEALHLYIEIVKCKGLISVDKGGHSDPYVKVKMDHKTVHQTKHIEKTLNPLFSAETHNSFALHCPATDLYDAHGLVFKVKDYDFIGKNEELGSAHVPANVLFNANGEDMDLKLQPPKGIPEDREVGYITIRCRPTAEDDNSGEQKKFLGILPSPRMELPKVPELINKMKKDRALDPSELEEPRPLFIQILSGRKLLSADANGLSDPFVKLKLGTRTLHETKPVTQTLEPIYEPRHNPYYLLEANPAEVKLNGGILIKVYDWDRLGKSDNLGEVLVDPDKLYGATGEKMELALLPPAGKAEEAGFISIRVRPATEEDLAMKKQSMFNIVQQAKAHTIDYGEQDLSLLLEIVSGWHLPIADLTASDPYVVVSIGHRRVHKTKAINNTRDPIYTVKEQSVFVLDVATKELKDHDGITFQVMDFDLVGKHDALGQVTVPADKILEASGDRLELQLRNKGVDAGFLAIRCRPVKEYEREFLATLSGSMNISDFMGVKMSHVKAMNPFQVMRVAKGMVTRRTRMDHGVKMYRVRPYPDPERKDITEFMSKKDIEAEALKDSRRWLDIGSGSIGKVFVEIIGCDGLPNLDQDLGTGNKTDSFVSVVYEDNAAKTDRVDDCLSPRWLPWMQRAFVFRMMHPSSNLYVGVFDYDAGIGNDHDIAGRVSIDLANFQPNTEYVLRYKLYENSIMSERDPRGVIMIRLRIERKSEKDMILKCLQTPPDFYVNVKDRKDCELVRQTVGGRQNLDAYSTKTIGLYADELMSYSVAKSYLLDAAIALIFWRGQVRVFGIWLPVHSFVLFVCGIVLAERPSLYPSFFFFCLGWMLLATVYWRNNSINPWMRSKTFAGLLTAIATGYAIDGPSTNIPAHYLEEESKAEEKIYNDRIEKLKRADEERTKAQLKLAEEHQSQVAQIGDQTADTNMATSSAGVSLDPLKFVLYPLQQYLALTCKILRFCKNVLFWDEPYLAFILTFVFFGVAIVLSFLPWAFLFRWTSRLVAWLLLGPQMRLVDIFWYSKYENMTDEEFAQKMRSSLESQLHAARGKASIARIRREEAIKLLEIKKMLYGNYITKVPVLRMERFPDIPLHSSAAQPYKAPSHLAENVPERIAGQHLVGTMIPRILDPDASDPHQTLGATDATKKKEN